MIDHGIARESDFTGPELDEENDLLYRTALGPRGCIFLESSRGCRLHQLGYKPETCVMVPRDDEEIVRLVGFGMLPCCVDRATEGS